MQIICKNPLPDPYKVARVKLGIDVFFQIQITSSLSTLIPAVTSIQINLDNVNLVQSSGIFAPQYLLTPQIDPTSLPIDVFTFKSLNPTVGDFNDIDNNQLLKYVSDGVCEAVVIGTNNTTNYSFSARSFFNFASSSSGSFNTMISAVAGSTKLNAISSIDTRITNVFPNSALNIFTTQNHASQIYVRNVNCWCYDIDDITCISPWNSTGGAQRAGTLITPRHIIFAAHYPIEVGATVRFVDKNNNVINRTMVARKTHPSYTPYFPDLTVGVLDEDVPPEIHFAKVLPNNWMDRLPTGVNRVPSLTLDQQEKALITDVDSITPWRTNFIPPDINSQRYLFYEPKISGDSGNPAFLIINEELVILTVWTYGGAGGGTSITYFVNDINTLIHNVDILAGSVTGYTCTPIDLSSFLLF